MGGYRWQHYKMRIFGRMLLPCLEMLCGNTLKDWWFHRTLLTWQSLLFEILIFVKSVPSSACFTGRVTIWLFKMKLLSTVRTVNNNSISSILRCRDVSSQFTFLCDRSRQNSYHNVLRSFRRITPLQLTEAAGFDDGVGSNDDQHNKISEKAEESDSETDNSATVGGSLLAIAVILGTVAAIGGAGYVFKDQLNVFLQHFEGIVEGARSLLSYRCNRKRLFLNCCFYQEWVPRGTLYLFWDMLYLR